MKKEDVKVGMEVKSSDILKGVVIGKKGDFVLVQMSSNNVLWSPAKNLVLIKDVDFYSPKEIDRKIEEETMNEKKSSESNDDFREKITKLQRAVDVVEKDLYNQYEKTKELSQRITTIEDKLHDPIPELTETEDHILWLVSEDYEWVAKDPADDAVCVFTDKPTYDKQFREWTCEDETDFKSINLDDVAEFENLPTSRPFKIVDLFKEG